MIWQRQIRLHLKLLNPCRKPIRHRMLLAGRMLDFPDVDCTLFCLILFVEQEQPIIPSINASPICWSLHSLVLEWIHSLKKFKYLREYSRESKQASSSVVSVYTTELKEAYDKKVHCHFWVVLFLGVGVQMVEFCHFSFPFFPPD
jgi:hypothetical protein